MEHPEKFDADKEFGTYKNYVNFYNNFIQEMSVLVENKIPDFVFDDLQDAFETIMWANWIPTNLKITTVSSGGSGNYNDGTPKTYTSYETGLGKSTSGVIAALKRLGVLDKLGLEMTDARFEEWESEVIELVKWGEKYTPKALF